MSSYSNSGVPNIGIGNEATDQLKPRTEASASVRGSNLTAKERLSLLTLIHERQTLGFSFTRLLTELADALRIVEPSMADTIKRSDAQADERIRQATRDEVARQQQGSASPSLAPYQSERPVNRDIYERMMNAIPKQNIDTQQDAHKSLDSLVQQQIINVV